MPRDVWKVDISDCESAVFAFVRQASLVAQTVTSPPAMQETGVGSLGQEHPLEKRRATHSNIPAWRIPWTEEPGGLRFMRPQSRAQLSDSHVHFFTFRR